MREPDVPLTAAEVLSLATGDLRCSRMPWGERHKPDCGPGHLCPVHEKIATELRRLAALVALAEGKPSHEVTRHWRDRAIKSSSPKHGHKGGVTRA